MKLNFTSPINNFSYGLVGLNILLELVKQGVEVAWWPIGQSQAAPEHHEILKQCVVNTQSYSKDSPSLRIFHEFDLAQHVGTKEHVSWPIFEVNKFNAIRRNHLSNQDKL